MFRHSPSATAVSLLLGIAVFFWGYSKYATARDAVSHQVAVRSSLLETERLLKEPGAVPVLLAHARTAGEAGRKGSSLRDRVRQAASEAGVPIQDAQESRQKLTEGIEETTLTVTLKDVPQDRLARLIAGVEDPGRAGAGSPPIVSEAVFKPNPEGVRHEYKEARLVIRERAGGAK